MDLNHIFGFVICCFFLLQLCEFSQSLYVAKSRPSYGKPLNVYKPVYLASGNNVHNSLHGPISGGGYSNFGSRLPVMPNGYDNGYAARKYVKHVKENMAKQIVKKTFINSKTDVNIRKDQPLTVVFNRPKPVIVLDRRPIINVINKVENKANVVNKQKVSLVGTVGRATGQKTINVAHGGSKSQVNVGGARINMKGGNAIGGKAKVRTGDINLNFYDKKHAGVFQRPGMIEAAMVAGGFGQVVGPQFAMGGQNIDISSLLATPPLLPDVPIVPSVPSVPSPGAFDVMDAIALKTAVARLEQKITGMQHNVNINNNNNNQNVNNNANNVNANKLNNNNLNNHNDLNNNVNGGFDMDNLMMAMMLNGGELSDAMVESMTRKLTGVGGAPGGGSGSGGAESGGGGGGGTKTIKIGPENTTGKSVVLKVDGNVQISKSSILAQ
ncbi:uncharacterized protein LOC134718993 [Mytilus trossulus]|uniref:uncharacterized protein LOC134718993 n=1 Tax=Mytilus trossulus TaxID=6551 RepID=UPI0030068379